MKVTLIDITEKPIEKVFKAYRICYSKTGFNEVKPRSDKEMIEFIKPLMDLGHTSPLEHISFTFSIEGISRACLAQLTRHRTFKFNVQSQRYVDGNNFDFVLPKLDYLEGATRKTAVKTFVNNFEMLQSTYSGLCRLGVKKEDARAILPNMTTCNLVVTCDLHNFRNFLKQRLCKEAQQEIRELAEVMNALVKQSIPYADYKVLSNCKKCGKCK